MSCVHRYSCTLSVSVSLYGSLPLSLPLSHTGLDRVCAQMFVAALRQRPAEVGIAELLLDEAAVPGNGLLPIIPAAGRSHFQGKSVHGYQIEVATSDQRGGGRLVQRSLGEPSLSVFLSLCLSV